MVGSGTQTLLELSYTLSTRLTWLNRKGFARTRIRAGDIVVAAIHGIANTRPRGADTTSTRSSTTFAIATTFTSVTTGATAITIGVVTFLTATTTTNDHRTSSRYRQHAHPVHLQMSDRSYVKKV
ncbi:hypothetical protein WN48_05547 [Eufriesea mexicana]|uniref:Uncharacterized protein n=1 Tax=Eufriesea mexicana TaxID=516756 RepID=A0A310S992_9HYME|nr:hypothetical protein WN48_05547 [Eufriesea mexicana]